MARWRVALHALDRTGPPVLARGLLRWVHRNRPDDDIQVVAFRGGPVADELAEIAEVHVLLEPSEAWDHASPDPGRLEELRARARTLAPVDATLLVSVAAGQILPVVPAAGGGPVVTWSVEQGEDLHWLTSPVPVVARTDRWLAGSEGTRSEIAALVPGAAPAAAPEFIEATPPPDPAAVAACRAAVEVSAGGLLVLGAGIATHRKAPDLFIEAALAHQRLPGSPDTTYVWIGGHDDPLYEPVRSEVRRLGLHHVHVMPAVVDIEPWCAAADVLLHPARLDAFPLICLHAAAVGTPVVAFSGVGGVPEMLGDTFLGTPYPDLGGLVRLAESLRDPDRRRATGDRQRARVRARFTDAVAASTVIRHLLDAAGLAA